LANVLRSAKNLTMLKKNGEVVPVSVSTFYTGTEGDLNRFFLVIKDLSLLKKVTGLTDKIEAAHRKIAANYDGDNLVKDLVVHTLNIAKEFVQQCSIDITLILANIDITKQNYTKNEEMLLIREILTICDCYTREYDYVTLFANKMLGIFLIDCKLANANKFIQRFRNNVVKVDLNDGLHIPVSLHYICTDVNADTNVEGIWQQCGDNATMTKMYP
jgi:hypothetical protein